MPVIFIGQGAADWSIKMLHTTTLARQKQKTDDPNLKVAYICSKYIQQIFVETPEAIDFFLFVRFRDRLAVL